MTSDKQDGAVLLIQLVVVRYCFAVLGWSMLEGEEEDDEDVF